MAAPGLDPGVVPAVHGVAMLGLFFGSPGEIREYGSATFAPSDPLTATNDKPQVSSGGTALAEPP